MYLTVSLKPCMSVRKRFYSELQNRLSHVKSYAFGLQKCPKLGTTSPKFHHVKHVNEVASLSGILQTWDCHEVTCPPPPPPRSKVSPGLSYFEVNHPPLKLIAPPLPPLSPYLDYCTRGHSVACWDTRSWDGGRLHGAWRRRKAAWRQRKAAWRRRKAAWRRRKAPWRRRKAAWRRRKAAWRRRKAAWRRKKAAWRRRKQRGDGGRLHGDGGRKELAWRRSKAPWRRRKEMEEGSMEAEEATFVAVYKYLLATDESSERYPVCFCAVTCGVKHMCKHTKRSMRKKLHLVMFNL